MTEYAPKQEPPYGLRMGAELKAKVKASALANGRSMNSEICQRLEQTFGWDEVHSRPHPAPDDTDDPKMAELRKEIDLAVSETVKRVLGTEYNMIRISDDN